MADLDGDSLEGEVRTKNEEIVRSTQDRPHESNHHKQKTYSKLFKKGKDANDSQVQKQSHSSLAFKSGDNGDLSIEETNRMRASLGLKPLK